MNFSRAIETSIYCYTIVWIASYLRLIHELRFESNFTSHFSLAVSLLYRNSTQFKISENENSSRLIRRNIKNASTKSEKISLQLIESLQSRTTAAVNDNRNLKFAKRQEVVSVDSKHQVDKEKRISVRASSQESRVSHKQEASINEKSSDCDASEMMSSLTLSQSHRSSSLSFSSTASHRLSEFISSFQKWTDYVNHTFNANQREAFIRISLSRRDRMSQRASFFYRSKETTQRQYDDVVARSYNDWITWIEVAIVLYDLTFDVSTHDLWSNSWSLKQLQQEE